MSRKEKNELEGGDTGRLDRTESVQLKPLQVVVIQNNFERAFKAFKALVQRERVLSNYKEKGYYEKPSVKKRRKRNEAARDRLSQQNKKR